MAARWIAAAVALITFAIVGFFVVVALQPPTAPTNAGLPSGIRMTSRPWMVAAQLESIPAGVEARVSIRSGAGQVPADLPPPTAEFQMVDMAMPPVTVALGQESAGTWRGVTRLPMPGRWNFVVTIEAEELSFPFTTPVEGAA